MLIREYLTTRKDGVKLFKTYSDSGFYIRKVGTNEIYDLAIDVENAPFEYEETDKKIDRVIERTSENTIRVFFK